MFRYLRVTILDSMRQCIVKWGTWVSALVFAQGGAVGLSRFDAPLTRGAETCGMPEASPDDRPLASYVLRVRGRPAILRYEPHDLRNGERRIFLRVEHSQ